MISPIIEENKFLNSLEIQKRLTRANNYNDWLFRQIEGYASRRILEVGCAVGNFTKKIINREFVCAIDIEDGYVRTIKDAFKGSVNFKAFKYDISSPEVRGLKEEKFDTVLCLNVLEHVERDSAALENMYHLLEEGGCLCLIVPAFQSIFGEMDKTDHHCRRYNKSTLLKKVEKAGFEVIKLKYMNTLGFFGWWFNGRIIRKRFIPFRQTMIFDKIIPLVSFIEGFFNPPFGQSLVLIARKRTHNLDDRK